MTDGNLSGPIVVSCKNQSNSNAWQTVEDWCDSTAFRAEVDFPQIWAAEFIVDDTGGPFRLMCDIQKFRSDLRAVSENFTFVSYVVITTPCVVLNHARDMGVLNTGLSWPKQRESMIIIHANGTSRSPDGLSATYFSLFLPKSSPHVSTGGKYIFSRHALNWIYYNSQLQTGRQLHSDLI